MDLKTIIQQSCWSTRTNSWWLFSFFFVSLVYVPNCFVQITITFFLSIFDFYIVSQLMSEVFSGSIRLFMVVRFNRRSVLSSREGNQINRRERKWNVRQDKTLDSLTGVSVHISPVDERVQIRNSNPTHLFPNFFTSIPSLCRYSETSILLRLYGRRKCGLSPRAFVQETTICPVQVQAVQFHKPYGFRWSTCSSPWH